jgi:hypothetical protein
MNMANKKYRTEIMITLGVLLLGIAIFIGVIEVLSQAFTF